MRIIIGTKITKYDKKKKNKIHFKEIQFFLNYEKKTIKTNK